MKTTQILQSLQEWRDYLKKQEHPVTLTLNAAITHLEELHQLGAEMVATTGARPESLDSDRPFFESWENRFEKLTGTDYFMCRTQHLPK